MNDVYNIIGVMSGTSLDGVDLAYIQFNQNQDNIEWKWLATNFYPYSDEWVSKLKKAQLLSSSDLLSLDAAYGYFLGEIILHFIEEFNLENIDAIASHGHTIFHQPENNFTNQIGNGAYIYAKTGIKTIYDFRSLDIALGGQGAPLVPIGDKLLFSNYDACINLGGFANISYDESSERIAFDICAVNFVSNYYAQLLGFSYDEYGNLAASGKINECLLSQLNQLKYYKINPPKSLGREWVDSEVFPIINQYKLSIKDVLSTYNAHVSQQISNVINERRFKKILMSGGGVLNKFLIDNIQLKTTASLVLAEERLLHFKEALIFAFLGYLRITNQINVLKTVTGAHRDSSSGIICG